MKTMKSSAINPKIRRFLIFSVTVGGGSILILYDIPIGLLIGVTVAMGCLMLILLGAVNLADIRPARIRENIQIWKEKRKQAATTAVQAGSVQKSELSRFGMILGSLPGALHDGFGHLKTTLFHREEALKEIDTKLDSVMKGEDILPDPAISRPVAPVSGGAEMSDSSLDVSMEDLDNLDLDDVEAGSAPSSSPDIQLDKDLPLPATDEATVSSILKENASELEEFSELGDINELDGLDDVNLDELDLPDEEDLAAEVNDLSPEPDAKTADASAEPVQPPAAPPQPVPPEQPAEEKTDEENMLAFAKGGGDPDALMELLKADSKKKKTDEYDSLLRDMKDVKVSAADLVTELQDTLDILNNPKKQEKQQND